MSIVVVLWHLAGLRAVACFSAATNVTKVATEYAILEKYGMTAKHVAAAAKALLQKTR